MHKNAILMAIESAIYAIFLYFLCDIYAQKLGKQHILVV